MLFGAPLGQRFERVTLADVQVHDGNRVAVELAKRVANGEALSLMLYGETARGKTMLLAAVLNEVEKRWPSGRYGYWPLGELALARRSAVASGQTDPIQSLLDAQVVAIDDIGVEVLSDYAMEGLQTVVDRRWRDNLPLLLASNLDPTHREFGRRYGPRILRRFIGGSAWLCEMGGASWATREAPRSPDELKGTDWASRLTAGSDVSSVLERLRKEREAIEQEDPEARRAALEAIARLKEKIRADK